jgi:putative transcriptional regulator
MAISYAQRDDTMQNVQESQMFGLVLGSVVERLRRKHGWTQADLAAKLAVSQPVVSRIEGGKLQPDAYLYGRLAAVFGMTVEGLHTSVNEAVQATNRAAAAVSKPKSSDDIFAAVGVVGLMGLIAFAVAALLNDKKT